MTGMVLCGGQSSRMGTDKGLLLHQSTTWTQMAAGKLQQVQLPVLISVNGGQLDTYRNLFQTPILIADDNTLTVGGPLKGLLSVHKQLPEEDLLVLACDMCAMQAAVLEQLLTTYGNDRAEAVVFRKGDYVEPLCGIYAATGLQKVYKRYQHGHLKKFSMQSVLQELDARYLPILPHWESSFRNFNTPADLDLR